MPTELMIDLNSPITVCPSQQQYKCFTAFSVPDSGARFTVLLSQLQLSYYLSMSEVFTSFNVKLQVIYMERR